jgi:hypothetical protein
MRTIECEDCGFQCSLEGSEKTYIRGVIVRDENDEIDFKNVCIDCRENYEEDPQNEDMHVKKSTTNNGGHNA